MVIFRQDTAYVSGRVRKTTIGVIFRNRELRSRAAKLTAKRERGKERGESGVECLI